MSWSRSGALNDAILIEFSTDLDPLGVTARSVRVFSDSGQPLAHRRVVRGRQIRLWLRLDERLFAQPPGGLQVRLAGMPSLHALRSSSGAPLSGPHSLEVQLEPRLAHSGSVRLQSINDRPAEERGEVTHDGHVALVFEGVVDPHSATPSNCPLFPIAAGLQLKPLLPDTRWSLVGTRCEIQLVLPSSSGLVELIWKRLGLRGLDGRPLQGPLVVTLSTS